MLGAAFKPHSDDILDSPALDVARAIQADFATVAVHDPNAMNARRIAPELLLPEWPCTNSARAETA